MHGKTAKEVNTEQPEPLTLHERARKRDIKNGRRLSKIGNKERREGHITSTGMSSLTESELTHLAKGWSDFTRWKFGIQHWLLPRGKETKNLEAATRVTNTLPKPSIKTAEMLVTDPDLSEVLCDLEEKHDIAKPSRPTTPESQ